MRRPRGMSALAILLVGGALAPGGCDRAQPVAPPEIHYGSAICALCGMIISDERFACASLEARDGGGFQEHLFDDPGCLLAWDASHADATFLARYVSDHGTRRWVEASEATFVHSRRLQTPMGSGVAAFAASEDAATFAQAQGGDLLNLQSLAQRHRAGELTVDPDEITTGQPAEAPARPPE